MLPWCRRSRPSPGRRSGAGSGCGGRPPDRTRRPRNEVVQGSPAFRRRLELGGLVPELLVGQLLDLRLERAASASRSLEALPLSARADVTELPRVPKGVPSRSRASIIRAAPGLVRPAVTTARCPSAPSMNPVSLAHDEGGHRDDEEDQPDERQRPEARGLEEQRALEHEPAARGRGDRGRSGPAPRRAPRAWPGRSSPPLSRGRGAPSQPDREQAEPRGHHRDPRRATGRSRRLRAAPREQSRAAPPAVEGGADERREGEHAGQVEADDQRDGQVRRGP